MLTRTACGVTKCHARDAWTHLAWAGCVGLVFHPVHGRSLFLESYCSAEWQNRHRDKRPSSHPRNGPLCIGEMMGPAPKMLPEIPFL